MNLTIDLYFVQNTATTKDPLSIKILIHECFINSGLPCNVIIQQDLKKAVLHAEIDISVVWIKCWRRYSKANPF